MPADELTASVRGVESRLPQAAWRAWQRQREIAGLLQRSLWGHHGVWSLGIGLLRNLRMSRKTAMVALVLMLPGGLLLHDALELWRERHASHQGAMVGFVQYRALMELNLTLHGLFQQQLRREQRLPAESLQTLRAQEAERFALLRERLQQDAGMAPASEAVARMVMYKAFCDLLWTLWGVIQHANDNPADDFWAYATTRFERCRALMATSEFAAHLAVLRS